LILQKSPAEVSASLLWAKVIRGYHPDLSGSVRYDNTKEPAIYRGAVIDGSRFAVNFLLAQRNSVVQ
jgi:hypothetical protein